MQLPLTSSRDKLSILLNHSKHNKKKLPFGTIVDRQFIETESLSRRHRFTRNRQKTVEDLHFDFATFRTQHSTVKFSLKPEITNISLRALTKLGSRPPRKRAP